MLIVGVCGITGSAIIIIFGYIGNVIRNSRIFVSVIRRSCSPVAAEFAGLIPPRTKAVVECGKGRIVVNDTVLTDNAEAFYGKDVFVGSIYTPCFGNELK